MALDVSRYLDGLAVGAHRESIFEKAARFYRATVLLFMIAAYLFMRIVLLVVSRR